MTGLSHIGSDGSVRMVDVSAKPVVHREAEARGEIRMARGTVRKISSKGLPKGDVLATAKIAAIQAAKRTSDWIPMCHPLPLHGIEVEFKARAEAVEITCRVRTDARTGVEMEALTAVSAAALTIYDMCKAVDKKMTIENIRLVSKTKS